jgi:hypothetical protein
MVDTRHVALLLSSNVRDERASAGDEIAGVSVHSSGLRSRLFLFSFVISKISNCVAP